MTPTQTVLVIVALLVLVLAAVVWSVSRRRRALRERFGPEYDRLVSNQDGGHRQAERELRERERRHAQLELRPLSDESRQHYTTQWEDVQAQFVDDPKAAVAAGDELLTRLVAERGYPTDDRDEQLAYLSVEHANTLSQYRQAHDISLASERGEATTEQLRQALVHYRSLFAELLGTEPIRHSDTTAPTQATPQ